MLIGYGPVANAITRGSNDDNSPQASVVVLIQSQNNRCTGTLISPVAVLTAKHCITGDNFSGQNTFGGGGGRPAAIPPFVISVGNPIGNGTAAVGTYNSDPAKPPSVYGDNGPVNDQEHGTDVAIIWLDPANPAISFAKIARPALASPVPSDGDDSEGGSYNVPIGVAGWSAVSNHDPSFRQVAYYDAVYHYPGYPSGGPGTPSGQYWVHAQGAGNIEPGDSGGPLFWRDSDGTRHVIGVAGSTFQAPFAIDGFDCTLNRCDIWTDVTRGAIAGWIRQQMLDTSKSKDWLI